MIAHTNERKVVYLQSTLTYTHSTLSVYRSQQSSLCLIAWSGAALLRHHSNCRPTVRRTCDLFLQTSPYVPFFPLVEDIFANAHSRLGRNLCRYTFNKWVSSKTDGTLLSARDLNRLSKFSAFQHNLFYFQARKDFFSPVSRIKCWQINVSAKHRCAHICRLSFNIRNRDTTGYSGQFPALLVATKAYFFIKKPQVF